MSALLQPLPSYLGFSYLGCGVSFHGLLQQSAATAHYLGRGISPQVIQAYAPTSNTEEAEVEWFYEDLQGLLELPPHLSCMRDSKRDTDVYNSLLDSVGEGESGMIWENGIEIRIISYMEKK